MDNYKSNLSIDYGAIGKKIKISRIRKGFSQDHLACKLDITEAHLSNIETGKSNFSLKILIGICNTLEVSPNYLLFSDKEINETSDKTELIEIFADCTPTELKLISNVTKTLKDELRERK